MKIIDKTNVHKNISNESLYLAYKNLKISSIKNLLQIMRYLQ